MVRALIIDDDRSIRRTLEKLFSLEGYEVSTAADGEEGLRAIRVANADVVLLDLGLPRLDGLDVLAAARALPDVPPIVVITAREDMHSTVRAVQLGAYDYLVKPLDIERLKLAARRAVQSREPSHLGQECAWPGSSGELSNALPCAAVLAKVDGSEAALVAIGPLGDVLPADLDPEPLESAILPLYEVEKRHITKALAGTDWNKRRTCALLKISRPTLDRKIEEYGIKREP